MVSASSVEFVMLFSHNHLNWIIFDSTWMHNIPSYLYSPQCAGGTPGEVRLGPAEICIRIQTLNENGAEGYLTANIDIGDEVQPIVGGATYRSQNSVVVNQQCYKHVVEIKVSGSSNDAWSGNFLYSVRNSIDFSIEIAFHDTFTYQNVLIFQLDKGATWKNMVCVDCDGETVSTQ
jgi:hypothetical protein